MPLARKRNVFWVSFLILGLLPLSAGVSLAEDGNKLQDTPNQAETVPPPQQAPAQKDVAVKNITAIEIQGNKSISSNSIIAKMKVKVGIPYQENVVNDDLKRLYLLGYFSDIKIDTADYKDGVKIIVTVTERPIIEKITFSGFKRVHMSAEKQKEALKSKDGQYLDYPNLEQDVQTLKKMYEKIGYTQAQISYKVDVDKDTNKAKLKFEAVEGVKVRIRKIFFEGNKNFKAGRLLKLLKTKRAWLFNAGVLKEDVLREDVERVKAFYRKNGYADVLVDYTVKPGSKKSFLEIFMKIREGKKYIVGSVSLRGNKDISEKELLAKLQEAVAGKVFSQEAVKQDIANIQGLYFDRGYISAQVQDAISMDMTSNKVNIVYNIVENNITYVDKIKIRGNVKTRDLVIRREMRIKPGERFDGEKLRRSKERLQNLGFFEDISYDTEDSNVPDKKDLVVDVKETKTGAFSFGGGYSTVDKLVGFVEIEQKNFDWKNFPYFTGAGQDLKFRASFGSLSQGYDLSFTEPWIFDYPVSFGFDVYKREHERDSDVGYGYDENVTGGDLRLGKELSEYVKGNLTYRNETIDVGSVSDTASQDLRDEAGVNTISSMEFGLSYDSRNNIFDPLKGDYLSGLWSVAGGPLLGDKDFWKFFGRASHYTPVFKASVIETRIRAGLADAYGDSSKVPIYERFFTGGADSIRGYRERKIGPLDVSNDPLGGESLLIGNIEYKYPLVNFIKLAVFYDIGNVWSKLSDFGTGGLKSGVGFGFRIKTPIGPILLDYGIPLNKEPGQDKKGSGRLHFNMSHGF